MPIFSVYIYKRWNKQVTSIPFALNSSFRDTDKIKIFTVIIVFVITNIWITGSYIWDDKRDKDGRKIYVLPNSNRLKYIYVL